MQVGTVDGDLQGTGCTRVKSGDCTRENGLAIRNSGGTTALAIMTR